MFRFVKIFAVAACITMVATTTLAAPNQPIEIGVFYFPGWHSKSDYWNDLKGLPGSRSPGVPWPNRIPLLGYYPEEEPWVAEKHIEWATQYGISFFAHEFYWRGNKPALEHALKAHMKAKNKKNFRFCLCWANEKDSPRSLAEFNDMVNYWLKEYVGDTTYYKIDGKPVVFIFDPDTLARSIKPLGLTPEQLLAGANDMARQKGHKGFMFVALSASEPSDRLENKFLSQGYEAYSAYNYVTSKNTSQYADYDSMVDTYLDYYRSVAKTKHQLLYMVPASPGWDGRPWMKVRPKIAVRENPTPAKFEKMLLGARELLVSQKEGAKVLMIGAWNEFAEGAYIEPTKEWGMQYLETIRKVFGAGSARK